MKIRSRARCLHDAVCALRWPLSSRSGSGSGRGSGFGACFGFGWRQVAQPTVVEWVQRHAGGSNPAALAFCLLCAGAAVVGSVSDVPSLNPVFLLDLTTGRDGTDEFGDAAGMLPLRRLLQKDAASAARLLGGVVDRPHLARR